MRFAKSLCPPSKVCFAWVSKGGNLGGISAGGCLGPWWCSKSLCNFLLVELIFRPLVSWLCGVFVGFPRSFSVFLTVFGVKFCE